MNPLGLTTFGAHVCKIFDLGDSADLEMFELSGGANRLWRFDIPSGRFVVKEFRYTVSDVRWVAAIHEAAEFESEVWHARGVRMAQPIRCASGDFVPTIVGSRGSPMLVRAHRWCGGERIVGPTDASTASAAGSQLSAIQQLGAAFRRRSSGSLRWWSWQPLDVIERLRRGGLINDVAARLGSMSLTNAEHLIAVGEASSGTWSFCHYDHKPANVLLTNGQITVLDWDEATLCHPRLEAVESALRWAGIEQGVIRDELFIAFLDGYRQANADIRPIERSDFAKCLAGIVGWFDYLGRRTLREFDDTDSEAHEALHGVRNALVSLDYVLNELSRWQKLANR